MAISTIVMLLHLFEESLRGSHVTSNPAFWLSRSAQKNNGNTLFSSSCETPPTTMAADGV